MDTKYIESLFETELTMQAAATAAKCRQPTVKSIWIDKFGEVAVRERKRHKYQQSKLGNRNPMKGKCWHAHHRFNHSGRISDQGGYVRVHAPSWYTASIDGYVREHILVYCEHNGLTELPEGMEIHHLDLSKQNNSPSNLVMLTARDHALLHGWISKTRSATTIP